MKERAGGKEGEREKERKKDTGTQALMEQRCFNDLSVSIYRLLYKKFILTMIKIRKPNIQQPLPREQGINNGHRLRRQSIPQERGSRLSSFVVKRMFTEGDSSLSHIMTSVLEAACCSTDKEQRTYEKQHVGILLLNTPRQFPLIYLKFVKRVLTIRVCLLLTIFAEGNGR